MYNKTSKVTEIVESNPISVEVKPFFYEESTDEEGQNVIVTNDFQSVAEKITETAILQEYIQSSTEVTEESIETVEIVKNEKFIDYNLVVKNEKGTTQREYLVNTETKEVKEVNVEVITEEVPFVMPQKPVISILPVEDKEVKPIVVEIIENRETHLKNIEEVTSVTKETVSKGTKYEIEYTTPTKEVKKIFVMKN